MFLRVSFSVSFTINTPVTGHLSRYVPVFLLSRIGLVGGITLRGAYSGPGHVTRKLSSVQRGPSLLLTGVVLKSPLDGPLDSLSRGKQ